MASQNPLQQLHHLDKSSSTFHDRLSNILYGEEYKKYVPNLQGDDLAWLVDYLDRALDTLDPASPAFRKCLRELRDICGRRMILPTSYTLSPSLLNIGRQPVASGGSGDIYEGTLNGSKVCVKRVRIYSKEGPKEATKTLYQEAVVWRHLAHPNILPLLGITPIPLQLISEWMPGGDLTEYIKKHPGAHQLGLLSGVATGLYYLHSCNIIHGDLKGPNILVDADGHARIADFGLATVTQNLDSIRSASDDHGHTARWTAPEILSEQGTYSKEADVFSFAMVMIEVYTGAVPFNNSQTAVAMLAIMKGTRPPRPTHPNFTDKLWALTQRCWNQVPHLRPEVSEVLEVLRGSKPPPIKTSMYRHGSASTVTVGQPQPLAEHKPPASYRPPLHKVPSSSHRAPQISPQKSSYSTGPLSPEGWGDSAGPDRTESVGQRDRSRAQMQDPQLEQQPVGRVSRRPSRRDTPASELSPPLPIDPQQYELDELHNQVYRYPGGGEKSRTNLQNTLDRSASRRNVSGKASRSGLNRGLEDNDDGKYWSGSRQDNRGASRSALDVGDGYQKGSRSRNPSRMDLRNNPSRDQLAQYNQSRTNLHDGGRTGSRPDLLDMGDGTLSRKTSRRDTTSVNPVYTTKNASRHDLRSGNKSRNPSQGDLTKMLTEHQPQTYQDQQGFPREQKKHAGASNPRADNGRGGKREREGKAGSENFSPQTRHGFLMGDDHRVPDPCVDAQADTPIFTSGPPRLKNDRTGPSTAPNNPQNRQETLREPKKHGGMPNQPMNGGPGGGQERETKDDSENTLVVSEETGIWGSIKKNLCCCC